MLKEIRLDINAEIEYARKWAFSRNPEFYDFDDIGGDCTNFVSQCILAGGADMNYTQDYGWYYISPDDRAAAWTGVEYFYNFIVNNRRAGPFGYDVPVEEAVPGDVIQLGYDVFYHSLFVVDVRNGIPYIASHSYDSFDRPLDSYTYRNARCIHIIGSRNYI